MSTEASVDLYLLYAEGEVALNSHEWVIRCAVSNTAVALFLVKVTRIKSSRNAGRFLRFERCK